MSDLTQDHIEAYLDWKHDCGRVLWHARKTVVQLSQVEFAEALGVSQGTVSCGERGKGTAEYLDRAATYCGVALPVLDDYHDDLPATIHRLARMRDASSTLRRICAGDVAAASLADAPTLILLTLLRLRLGEQRAELTRKLDNLPRPGPSVPILQLRDIYRSEGALEAVEALERLLSALALHVEPNS